MKVAIALLQLVGIFLAWLIFTALLVPCAVAVWLLKQIISVLSWVRDKAIGEGSA